MSIQQMLLGASGASGYLMDKSLRFRSSASAYLNRTPASAGNQRTFTWSGWFKNSTTATDNTFIDAYLGASDETPFRTNGNQLVFADYFGGAYRINCLTPAVFRDPAAWYHIVLAVDTTQATNSNGVKIWVNGVQQTLTFSAYTQNIDTRINSVTSHKIGRNDISGSSRYTDGYLADVNFIDGQALTPASFGETNALTGVWQPKAYTGTYGTNGFYLKFTDNSTAAALGTDFSGNSNTWTTNNISVTAGVTYDSMTDAPTLTSATAANYAVLNPIVAPAFLQGAVIDNGNLRVTGAGGVSNCFARSTIGISGKMYAEFFFDVVSSASSIGVAPVNDTASTGNLSTQSTNVCYRSGGNKRVLGTETAYGASWAANDIIGVAVDTSANTVEFFKNGTSQGVITSTAFFAQGACLFAISTDDTGSPRGYANFGQRPFAFSPPTGYVALNAFNLP